MDRFLATSDWRLTYPGVVVRRLDENGSDHAPIPFDAIPSSVKIKRRFKFQERWSNNEEACNIIKEAWNAEVVGSPMFKLSHKLKEL